MVVEEKVINTIIMTSTMSSSTIVAETKLLYSEETCRCEEEARGRRRMECLSGSLTSPLQNHRLTVVMRITSRDDFHIQHYTQPSHINTHTHTHAHSHTHTRTHTLTMYVKTALREWSC